MTRENKLALVIGFGLILFVGILVSDHFSAQRLDSAQLSQAGIARPANEPQVVPIGPDVMTLTPPGQTDGTAVAGTGTAGPAGTTPAGGTGNGANGADASGQQALPITVAMGDEEEGTPVRFYKVAQGDTLWKIAAREYGDGSLCKELADYNKVALGNGVNLSLNQELRLPSLKKLRPTRMATSVAAASVGTHEPASTATSNRTHTVAKGDTIYQLSRKFNIKAQAIMAANGIRDAASLQPGQTLVIPSNNY